MAKDLETSNIMKSSATKVIWNYAKYFFTFFPLQWGGDLFRVSTTAFVVLAERLIQEAFSPDWKHEFHSNTNTKKEYKINLGGKLGTRTHPKIIYM